MAGVDVVDVHTATVAVRVAMTTEVGAGIIAVVATALALVHLVVLETMTSVIGPLETNTTDLAVVTITAVAHPLTANPLAIGSNRPRHWFCIS